MPQELWEAAKSFPYHRCTAWLAPVRVRSRLTRLDTIRVGAGSAASARTGHSGYPIPGTALTGGFSVSDVSRRAQPPVYFHLSRRAPY